MELNDRLEQEAAMSEALTRSSSLASLMEVSTKSLPSNPKKNYRKYVFNFLLLRYLKLGLLL